MSTTNRAKRFIIEGEWSGYHSGQRRVVHRTVHKGSYKKLRAWAQKTHSVLFTDGTALRLTVRDCKPREKVQQIKGYVSLISDCAMYDVDSVHTLTEARAALRAAHKAEVKVQREEMLDGDGRRNEWPV